jgi:hypothetical protein
MCTLLSRFYAWRKASQLSPKLSLGLALLSCAPLAIAQNNLGELLDAGAKQLSVEEFNEQVVQRIIVGPTATGGTIQVMYATNGSVQGNGAFVASFSTASLAPISGEWKVGDDGRICTSMQMGSNLGGGPGGMLPFRCQLWFKLADQYFLSDSDSDRRAKVLRRTIKQ